MHYREKLNIIIMRDNGPRRSFHIRRNRFVLLMTFFLCLPFVAILLTTQCWWLWTENIKLRDSIERMESEYQAMEIKAERLENLEELLREENVPGRALLIKQLATNVEQGVIEESPLENDNKQTVAQQPELAEGPGHEEFPAIDSGRLKINNVQVRVLRSNSLRIGLDLRNPDNEPLISGEVNAILITADGARQELHFDPAEVGNFRISRFKRAVMVAKLPRNINMVNAQIILEVKDQAGKDIYRNIFAVQR